MTAKPEERVSSFWGAKRLRLAVDAAGIALWSWNVDTDLFEMDDHAFGLWGMPPSGAISFRDRIADIYPADRARVRAEFAATRGVIDDYEIDFRIMTGGHVRWISARGKGDDAGIVDRVMFGTFLDISDRKRAEENHELLAAEMRHRVKNLLSIAIGLTSITARSAKSVPDMADALTQRLLALGRAHDLTRPVSEGGSEDGALLGDLLAVLLAPYGSNGISSGRVTITVLPMCVGERAATSLALVIHELATNALKYGSLSTSTGTLDLSQQVDDEGVVLSWTERGGPPVRPTVGAGGFGSTLFTHSMAAQLGGSIEYDWSADGVVITLRIDPRRLA